MDTIHSHQFSPNPSTHGENWLNKKTRQEDHIHLFGDESLAMAKALQDPAGFQCHSECHFSYSELQRLGGEENGESSGTIRWSLGSGHLA